MAPMKKVIIAIIIAQSVIGLLLMVYAGNYRVLDTGAAGEMLEYIRVNNPEYYEKLARKDDTTYLKEFYEHYTIRGNRKIMLIGLFILILGINIAVPFLYFETAEKIKSLRKKTNEEDNTENGNPEEEKNEKKEDDRNVEEGQDF